MADFSAAFGAMRRGLKVRREGWAKYGLSLEIKDGDIVFANKVVETVEVPIPFIHSDDLLAADWEHIPPE